MNKIWIIVANAVTANIFSASEKERHLTLIKTLMHSNSVLKEHDFAVARPGHYNKGRDNIRGSYEETNHKTLEKEQFVKEICHDLEQGRTNHLYSSLIMVAEPNFYGLFNKHASPLLRNLVKHHLSRDYTHYSLKELQEELESSLAHQMRLLLIS